MWQRKHIPLLSASSFRQVSFVRPRLTTNKSSLSIGTEAEESEGCFDDGRRGRGFGLGRDVVGSDMATANEVSVRGKITLTRTSCKSHVDLCPPSMTSPPPLIFKKTRSKPAQRKRDASPEGALTPGNEGQAKSAGESAESPSVLAARLKSKVKKNKAKSKLSFGGDDEVGEWFCFFLSK